MIQNDKIVSEYGSFRGISTPNPLPSKFKPTPLKTDYDRGYLTRTCVVKRNDTSFGQEIDPAFAGKVDSSMYQVFTFTWRISGKRNRTVVNGIIEDPGVFESNSTTLKKLGNGVERFFNDPLEFWRGY